MRHLIDLLRAYNFEILKEFKALKDRMGHTSDICVFFLFYTKYASGCKASFGSPAALARCSRMASVHY